MKHIALDKHIWVRDGDFNELYVDEKMHRKLQILRTVSGRRLPLKHVRLGG